MFIGHFAVALAAKRAAPAVSLGVLFLACQLADLAWPTFVLMGIEQVEVEPGNTAFTPLRFVFYPYSHSLVALLGWGGLTALLYAVIRRASGWDAMVIALVVLSHWGLDALTHRPDMPLTITGATRVGLGLWNHVAATVAVESLMLVAGLGLYLRATRARNRRGTLVFWSLMGVLIAITVANIVGPPPPSAAAVVWAAQLMWLFVAWAFWADRHRQPVGARLR
jgi:hypothetical protein